MTRAFSRLLLIVAVAVPLVVQAQSIQRNLPYVPDGNWRQSLDLYSPEAAAKPHPVVIWIHGGAWAIGSKDQCPIAWLTREGYAVASINYRLVDDARFPAQIDDCKSAVRWLRANANKYQLNPNRIGAWGASAGGHLVALLGTTADVKELGGDDASRVQAVIDFFGPSDLLRFNGNAGQGQPEWSMMAVARLIGGRLPEKNEIAALASPVTHVSKGDAPFLIVHGTRDNTVPVGQSEVLHAALKKAGVESTLELVPGAGHGFGVLTPAVGQKIRAFLAKYLKN